MVCVHQKIPSLLFHTGALPSRVFLAQKTYTYFGKFNSIPFSFLSSNMLRLPFIFLLGQPIGSYHVEIFLLTQLHTRKIPQSTQHRPVQTHILLCYRQLLKSPLYFLHGEAQCARGHHSDSHAGTLTAGPTGSHTAYE